MYVIFLNNISASHLHRDDLHLNLNGTIPNFRVSMAMLNTIDISHRRLGLNTSFSLKDRHGEKMFLPSMQ